MLTHQLLVLLSILQGILKFSYGKEASVAFLCGKPTQVYSLKKSQWIPDMSSDCISEPDEILAYCQRQYPLLNVTYILPAQDSVTIDNWCRFGMLSCNGLNRHTSHQVKPYRCLSGNFQSDALLVPEHCQFGHHTTIPLTVMPRPLNHRKDSVTCELFHVWNHTAQHVCAATKSRLQSFGVLFPCVKDTTHKAMYFSGVEYVCCPSLNNEENEPAKGYFAHDSEKDPVSISPPVEDYETYINQKDSTGPQYGSEHERYNKAKAALYAWQLYRRNVLEQQLAKGEKNIVSKLNKSPSQTKISQDALHRSFRNDYANLLEEQQNQRRQLETLHQQNVATRLEDRRRRAREEFFYQLKQIEGGETQKSDSGTPLDSSLPLLKRLNTAMEHWLRAIQKDRLQSVVFLNNLRVSDPAQAQEEFPVVRDHLNNLMKELQTLLDKIKKLPSYSKEVLSTYLELRKQLNPVDKTVDRSLTEPIARLDKTPTIFDVEADKIIHLYEHVGFPVRKTIHHTDEDSNHPVEISAPIPSLHSEDNIFKSKKVHHESKQTGLAIYLVPIITGIIAVFVALIFIIWCYRSRCTLHDYNSKAAYSLTVLEDEPPVVQGKSNYEAERLMHLQVNGFENPTYKFFENGMFPPQNSMK